MKTILGHFLGINHQINHSENKQHQWLRLSIVKNKEGLLETLIEYSLETLPNTFTTWLPISINRSMLLFSPESHEYFYLICKNATLYRIRLRKLPNDFTSFPPEIFVLNDSSSWKKVEDPSVKNELTIFIEDKKTLTQKWETLKKLNEAHKNKFEKLNWKEEKEKKLFYLEEIEKIYDEKNFQTLKLEHISTVILPWFLLILSGVKNSTQSLEDYITVLQAALIGDTTSPGPELGSIALNFRSDALISSAINQLPIRKHPVPLISEVKLFLRDIIKIELMHYAVKEDDIKMPTPIEADNIPIGQLAEKNQYGPLISKGLNAIETDILNFLCRFSESNATEKFLKYIRFFPKNIPFTTFFSIINFLYKKEYHKCKELKLSEIRDNYSQIMNNHSYDIELGLSRLLKNLKDSSEVIESILTLKKENLYYDKIQSATVSLKKDLDHFNDILYAIEEIHSEYKMEFLKILGTIFLYERVFKIKHIVTLFNVIEEKNHTELLALFTPQLDFLTKTYGTISFFENLSELSDEKKVKFIHWMGRDFQSNIFKTMSNITYFFFNLPTTLRIPFLKSLDYQLFSERMELSYCMRGSMQHYGIINTLALYEMVDGLKDPEKISFLQYFQNEFEKRKIKSFNFILHSLKERSQEKKKQLLSVNNKFILELIEDPKDIASLLLNFVDDPTWIVNYLSKDLIKKKTSTNENFLIFLDKLGMNNLKHFNFLFEKEELKNYLIYFFNEKSKEKSKIEIFFTVLSSVKYEDYVKIMGNQFINFTIRHATNFESLLSKDHIESFILNLEEILNSYKELIKILKISTAESQLLFLKKLNENHLKEISENIDVFKEILFAVSAKNKLIFIKLFPHELFQKMENYNFYDILNKIDKDNQYPFLEWFDIENLNEKLYGGYTDEIITLVLQIPNIIKHLKENPQLFYLLKNKMSDTQIFFYSFPEISEDSQIFFLKLLPKEVYKESIKNLAILQLLFKTWGNRKIIGQYYFLEIMDIDYVSELNKESEYPDHSIDLHIERFTKFNQLKNTWDSKWNESIDLKSNIINLFKPFSSTFEKIKTGFWNTQDVSVSADIVKKFPLLKTNKEMILFLDEKLQNIDDNANQEKTFSTDLLTSNGEIAMRIMYARFKIDQDINNQLWKSDNHQADNGMPNRLLTSS